MRKLIFAGLTLIISGGFSSILNAQGICAQLAEDHKNAEKKVESFSTMKIGMDDVLSVLDETRLDVGNAQDLLAAQESRARMLNGKIAGGDKSPEVAIEYKSILERIELLKMRLANNFNAGTFYKNPKYLGLQKNLDNVKAQELEAKREVARIETDMDVNHCPKPKKGDDGTGEITSDLDGWGGEWKNSDPTQGTINMSLHGTGNYTTGEMKFVIGKGRDMIHKIGGCVENGNKLVCTWTCSLEDEEKFLDLNGKVTLTLTDKSITSNWNETSITPRWKPGKQRDVIQRPLRNFAIKFVK